MVEFLLGVPGRLVALGTTLVTGISDILTAIGTRAPAGTAVSNTVLTDARIGNLDNIASAPMRIKSIQRGVILIFNGSGTATGTATITSVNVAKTELRFLGHYGADFAALTLENSTTIRATRTTNSTTMQTYVSWEATEYY